MSGILGAPSVTVIDASIAGPSTTCVSADTPVGRSIETMGTPSAFRSATTVSRKPFNRPCNPVPRIASTTS